MFISGQAAIDQSGRIVGVGDFDVQAKQAFENLDRVLRAGGSSLKNVIKVTIFLTDMGHFDRIVELRGQWFTAPYPAERSHRCPCPTRRHLTLTKPQPFMGTYGDILGLELLMDHGWFRTYGSDAKMTVQVSFGSEGGSGTSVPDLSIEVDDIGTALARFKKANVPIEYGPVSEPWGVRRFYVRDPFGKLINILQHE